jgi:leucyl-tRNA synthetase
MFMGPWDQGGPWSPTGIGGISRFLNRVWYAALDPHGVDAGDPESGKLPAGQDAAAAEKALREGRPRTLRVGHRGIRRAALQHDGRAPDGAVEPAPALPRHGGRRHPAWDEAVRLLLLMLAPARRTSPKSCGRGWPRPAARSGRRSTRRRGRRWTSRRRRERARVPVQVNGKLRDRVMVPVGIAEAELEALVLARPKIVAALDGKTPLKVIHAGGKLVNIVVR